MNHLAHSDLSDILKLELNNVCADCGMKSPRWASINIGVIICIQCSGIHRSLGVHISHVKSLTLDSWTPERIQVLRCIGNKLGRAYYEYSVPDSVQRPTNHDNVSLMETWIREKYQNKSYVPRNSKEPYELLKLGKDPWLSVNVLPGKLKSKNTMENLLTSPQRIKNNNLPLITTDTPLVSPLMHDVVLLKRNETQDLSHFANPLLALQQPMSAETLSNFSKKIECQSNGSLSKVERREQLSTANTTSMNFLKLGVTEDCEKDSYKKKNNTSHVHTNIFPKNTCSLDSYDTLNNSILITPVTPCNITNPKHKSLPLLNLTNPNNDILTSSSTAKECHLEDPYTDIIKKNLDALKNFSLN